jgi:hypothetical protein
VSQKVLEGVELMTTFGIMCRLYIVHQPSTYLASVMRTRSGTDKRLKVLTRVFFTYYWIQRGVFSGGCQGQLDKEKFESPLNFFWILVRSEIRCASKVVQISLSCLPLFL